MLLQYTEPTTAARFNFLQSTCDLQANFYDEQKQALLSIAWNRGADQKVFIDEVEYEFKKDHFLTLLSFQTFRFENPKVITLWQFNRDFYCIIDHDTEVSCAGFLFYGWHEVMFLTLEPNEIRKIDLLSQVFTDEFSTHDNIQGEMLRMLLKRLIIILTRIAKGQYIAKEIVQDDFDVVREFNILVEKNYRKFHQVQDYANLLHRSPKTLSNLFSKYHDKTPLQIIRERIFLEAKRLLLYTDKVISEITYELGFQETSHFSRFFKKMAGDPPGRFKENHKMLSPSK